MPGSKLNDTEKALLQYWEHSAGKDTLRGISIAGNPGLRGIRRLELEFRYPLAAICGRNGSGKTTILALAALAYHRYDGHVPRPATHRERRSRARDYYTFADFFYKGPGDPDISGVTITWTYNKGRQISITKTSRKWMHYERRPSRAVHYLGMSRSVPAIEQTVLRNYFPAKKSGHNETELNDKFLKRLAAIMDRPYDDAKEIRSSSYRLRACTAGASYSSFNMGAGEDLLIDLLAVFQDSPEGALIVIEEIELGLHPAALAALAKHMQEIALEKKFQIIVSTHSRDFLDALPRQARIMLQRGNDEHDVVYGPTTRFAMSQLTGRPQPEAIIYCEDVMAESLIEAALSASQRRRVQIMPVGDKAELARQAVAAERFGVRTKKLIFWDGDVSDKDARRWLETSWRKYFHETPWEGQIKYDFLPGNGSPESWIQDVLGSDEAIPAIVHEFNMDGPEDARRFASMIAARAVPHDLVHAVAAHLNIDAEWARRTLVSCMKRVSPEKFQAIRRKLTSVLDDR